MTNTTHQPAGVTAPPDVDAAQLLEHFAQLDATGRRAAYAVVAALVQMQEQAQSQQSHAAPAARQRVEQSQGEY